MSYVFTCFKGQNFNIRQYHTVGGYVTGLKDSRVWLTLEFKVNICMLEVMKQSSKRCRVRMVKSTILKEQK